ncbi:MAG: transcriptional regulator [Anaerolineales bacterium]
MTSKTTRQKILDYLKRVRTVSARELARALRMTPANARHHLNILSADGRIEVVERRQVGRGRPEKVYRLSGTLAGDNLSALADALLTVAGPKVDADALARHLAGEVDFAGQPLMRRLQSAVERLNEKHYQARWEAGAEGPRVLLGQCPYAAVIKKHPLLCRVDAALLGKLLGKRVQQTAKIDPDAEGLSSCIFHVELV